MPRRCTTKARSAGKITSLNEPQVQPGEPCNAMHHVMGHGLDQEVRHRRDITSPNPRRELFQEQSKILVGLHEPAANRPGRRWRLVQHPISLEKRGDHRRIELYIDGLVPLLDHVDRPLVAGQRRKPISRTGIRRSFWTVSGVADTREKPKESSTMSRFRMRRACSIPARARSSATRRS
jgi:hypothetical protein